MGRDGRIQGGGLQDAPNFCPLLLTEEATSTGPPKDGLSATLNHIYSAQSETLQEVQDCAALQSQGLPLSLTMGQDV